MWDVLVEAHRDGNAVQDHSGEKHESIVENPCSFVNRIDVWEVRVRVEMRTRGFQKNADVLTFLIFDLRISSSMVLPCTCSLLCLFLPFFPVCVSYFSVLDIFSFLPLLDISNPQLFNTVRNPFALLIG